MLRMSARPVCHVLAVLMLLVPVRAFLMPRPFLPNEEGTALGIHGIHAMNFARYGPFVSRFAGVLNTGQVDRENWVVYAHHPPLAPLLVSIAYRSFGVSEWSTRLVPSLFSIAATLLLYVIAYRRFGPDVALLAALFYAFCPMTLVFGGMPDYINAQLAFFMLLAVETYLKWQQTGRATWFLGFALSFVLGALTDWPMFFIVPVICGHYWMRTRHGFVRTLGLGAAGGAVFGALVLWANWSGLDTSMIHLIASRSIGGTADDQFFSVLGNLGHWAWAILLHNLGAMHTWPVVILAFIYGTLTVSRLLRRDWAALRGQDAAVLLLVLGLLHLTIGISGNTQVWWSAVVTAPLALAAALAVEILASWLRTRPRGALAIATIVLFLAFSAPTTYWESGSQWEHTRSAGYTPKELAGIIRAVSRPEEGVLTSDRMWDATLWFYADRQLRPLVDTVAKLESSLAPGPYWLAYGYVQPGGPAPRWFVMPPPHRQRLGPLANELEARFPRRDIDGYAVYQLF